MTGHGHVVPNPDGSKARCGGPAFCRSCAAEYFAVYGIAPQPRRTYTVEETLANSEALNAYRQAQARAREQLAAAALAYTKATGLMPPRAENDR